MIQAQELRRHYRMGGETIRALDGVSLSIEAGDSVAILGPSGSGKSTLMHLLGGLERPTSGSISVDGEELAMLEPPELARYRNEKVGFVFQSFNLQAHLTALENVELPLKLGNVPRRERRRLAEARLAEVGLLDRRDHRPSELSGGQRQRVSVARALVRAPRFLLADEPTGNLDSKTGAEILELFLRLNREQKLTLVIVTHNPELADRLGRRIVLRDGRLA
ncbi:MAG TPA: ABC transporter ATP-binding protein [Planctomycetota bacterium]|nr:ABC transporter ATP-binding protein [Planctomycetota bacterium]